MNVDPGTYQATRPDVPGLAYTHDGFVIGHPVGSNSEAFFLRLDQKFGDRWTGIVGYLDRSPKALDGPNPFDTSELAVVLNRDITLRGSVSLRYDRSEQPETEESLWLSANYAF